MQLEELKASAVQQTVEYTAEIEQLKKTKASLAVTVDVYSAKLVAQRREEKTKVRHMAV